MASPENNNANANEYENYTSQTGGRLFSSSMFGFNKEEVLEYLEELADENLQQQEAAEMRIQELSNRINQLEQNLAAAESNGAGNEEVINELNEVRAQLEQAQAQYEQLASQMEGDSSRQQELANQLDVANAASQQAEEELAQFKEDLNAARQENAWLREEHQNSGEQIAELQRQLEAITTAQNEQGSGGHSDEELAALQQLLDSANEELRNLRAELDEAKRGDENSEELTRQLAEAKQELAELRIAAEQKGGDEELQRDLDKALAELYALRQQLQEMQRTDAELDEQAKQEIAGLRAQLDEVVGIEEDLKRAQAEVNELHQQLEAAGEETEALESLRAHIAELVDENKNLRESLQKQQQEADAKLRAELDAKTSEIAKLADELESYRNQTVDDELQEQIDGLIEENDDMRAQIEEYKAYMDEWSEWDERRDTAERSASAIIDEANEEAERIRKEARAERERLQRQMQGSAGGLSESIVNLRDDLANVEGDVSGVLEAVQTALSDIMNALSRTEQNLTTLDVQVERFPNSAPPVPKQQVVYFQSSHKQAANQNGSAPKSFGSANFQRLDSSDADADGNVKAFRPSYTSSEQNDEQEEKLRALSETLVDTLRQMMN